MDIEINVVQFERMMKNIILLEFESVIPLNKKHALKNTKIELDDNNMNEANFQSKIIRSIFKFLIDVNCVKEIKVAGKVRNVLYGEYLTNGLIEYYTFLICNKYSAEYVMDASVLENFEFVRDLSNLVELDELAFSKDADYILSMSGLDKFKKKCDKDAVQKYLFDSSDSGNSDVNYNSGGSLYLIYCDGKQFLKFIDNNNATYHLEYSENSFDEIFSIYRSINFEENDAITRFFNKLNDHGIEPISSTKVSDGEYTEDTLLQIDEYDDNYNPDADNSDIINIEDEIEEVIDDLDIDLEDDKSYEDISETSLEPLDDEHLEETENSEDIEESIEEVVESETTRYDGEKINKILEKIGATKTEEEVVEEKVDEAKLIDSLELNIDNYIKEDITEEEEEEKDEEKTEEKEEAKVEPKNNKKVTLNITEKEYEELCMKAIKGHELTQEENDQMELFDKYYYGYKDKNDLEQENRNTIIIKEDTRGKEVVNNKAKEEIKGSKKVSENNNIKSEAPKKSKTFKIIMWTVIIIITIIVGIALGAALFRLKG